MLKKITLAALVAVGAATLAGVSALPAAADSFASVRVSKHGVFELSTHQVRRHWRGARKSRHGPRRRFLRRVRHGAIVCFAKPSRRHASRFGRGGHRHYRVRYDRAGGRRLGYRAVRRLVRHGRRHAMRCFRRY